MKQLYKDSLSKLILADAFEYMSELPRNSIDAIVTDPPYFLSNGGISNSGGKIVSVDKGEWDKRTPEDAMNFYQRFLRLSNNCLKPNGTIWTFGSMHNIYTLGYLMRNDFHILNNITWQKSNPAPNLSHRMFTHSTETILWAKKKNGKQLYNYDDMYKIQGVQMKDVWTTASTNKNEKLFGKHPTQKPLSVMLRIIQASTNTSSLILDPFVGSGTTCLAGKILRRRTIGIDNNPEYLQIAINRLKNSDKAKIGRII